jgi:beta-glucosidase
MSVAEGKGWREMVLSAKCLGTTGERLTFASKGAFTLQISAITRDDGAADAECSF